MYLALRARAWLRMSQSYDLSDVDTTLPRPTAAVAVVHKPRPTVKIFSPDTRPYPKTAVAYACLSAGWLRGHVCGKGANVEYQLR